MLKLLHFRHFPGPAVTTRGAVTYASCSPCSLSDPASSRTSSLLLRWQLAPTFYFRTCVAICEESDKPAFSLPCRLHTSRAKRPSFGLRRVLTHMMRELLQAIGLPVHFDYYKMKAFMQTTKSNLHTCSAVYWPSPYHKARCLTTPVPILGKPTTEHLRVHHHAIDKIGYSFHTQGPSA